MEGRRDGEERGWANGGDRGRTRLERETRGKRAGKGVGKEKGNGGQKRRRESQRGRGKEGVGATAVFGCEGRSEGVGEWKNRWRGKAERKEKTAEEGGARKTLGRGAGGTKGGVGKG